MADLPADIDQFIDHYFDSVERLETLILLRSHRRHEFSIAEVTAELRSGPSSAPAQLAKLCAHGFLVGGGDPVRYRYMPDSGEKERLLSELLRLYGQRRVTVIERIFSARRDQDRRTAQTAY
jgi:hypothetical protein